jgi:hypothetical protein
VYFHLLLDGLSQTGALGDSCTRDARDRCWKQPKGWRGGHVHEER